MLEFYILGDMGSGENSQYIVSNAGIQDLVWSKLYHFRNSGMLRFPVECKQNYVHLYTYIEDHSSTREKFLHFMSFCDSLEM